VVAHESAEMERAVVTKLKTGTRSGGQIFHGWWIVLTSAIGLFVGYPPIIVYSFSVFLNALTQTFNWSRAQVSLAFSFAALAAIIFSPFVGRLECS